MIMADVVSKTKRSEIMRAIKSRDSKLEIDFRKTLWKNGIRFRKSVKGYFGNPDILLKKHKTAIFIDSCFWHGCKRHCRIPSSKQKYWIEKIKRNKKRDRIVTRHYEDSRWNLFRFWEHDLKKNAAKCFDKLFSSLRVGRFKKGALL